MDLTEKSYKIPIDGTWYLDDLYIYPRTYEQVYFLLWALATHDEDDTIGRIEYAFNQYPWQGGYSAVNFYDKLKYTTPKQERPQVLSLQFESPGWIELSVIIGIAVAVERIVKAISSTIREANSVYNETYKGMQERKLLRIKVKLEEIKLAQQHDEYIEASAKRMARLLGIKNLKKIHLLTGSPLKTLKILLSLFRRVRTLAEFQIKGKTTFKIDKEKKKK